MRCLLPHGSQLTTVQVHGFCDYLTVRSPRSPLYGISLSNEFESTSRDNTVIARTSLTPSRF